MSAPEHGRRSVLAFRNRQRVRSIDLDLLRKTAHWLLREGLGTRHFELCVHLVGAVEITRLNETYLGHAGPTDVISFDQTALGTGEPEPIQPGRRSAKHVCPPTEALHGEIFVSLDAAVGQARRFRTSWQSELVRYLVHGLLHLAGHDDLKPGPRRCMKRAEDRLLRLAATRFPIRRLAQPRIKGCPAGRCCVL